MYVDPGMVRNNIEEAYTVFAGMGFEQGIPIQRYNLSTGAKIPPDHTIMGLWLNKDTIKVGREYQFLTEARPSVYFLDKNLVDDSGNQLIPDHSQRLLNFGKQYSVYSINHIFNIWIIRLKP